MNRAEARGTARKRAGARRADVALKKPVTVGDLKRIVLVRVRRDIGVKSKEQGPKKLKQQNTGE